MIVTQFFSFRLETAKEVTFNCAFCK